MPAALLPLAVAALGWAVLLAAGPRAGLAAYPLAPLLYLLPWLGLGSAPAGRVTIATILVMAIFLFVVPLGLPVGLMAGTALAWSAAAVLAWLGAEPTGVSSLWGFALVSLWFGPPIILAGAALAHMAHVVRGWAERAPARAPGGTAAGGALAALAITYAITIRLGGSAEALLPFVVLLVGFAPHALLTRHEGMPGVLRLLLVATIVVTLPLLLLASGPAPLPTEFEGGLST
ncbi:hypothetical protein [Roseomonas populi]|uniref:Uncharacterized protein n=1 Tax=Roseomonas populi TaxID=3121582 RepID=A0ABT1X5G7_9PROT|nr:hypothetical protein [Roseomonas pecuniae]MCR0982204.1 hypothetical protein [Roseomonas pecuniae]